MPYIYWDSTYILVVIGAVICMIASARVKTTFNKYSAYRSMSGMTGAQAAERILHAAGIYDVRVQHVSGNLTDHYNPANKTLNLSDSVCNQTSVAAVGWQHMNADMRSSMPEDMCRFGCVPHLCRLQTLVPCLHGR